MAGKSLPDQIAEESANVEFDESEVPVSVAMLIKFEFDSAELTELSKKQLDTIGYMLNFKELAGEKLLVEGHTDIVGSEAYNYGLSVQRAESVRRYLLNTHQIDYDRLYTAGKGENELLDTADPRGGINRRVQFSTY